MPHFPTSLFIPLSKNSPFNSKNERPQHQTHDGEANPDYYSFSISMAVQACHLNPFPPSLLPENSIYRNEEVADTLDMNACSVLSGHQMRLGDLSTNAMFDSNLYMHNIYQTNGFNTFDASPFPPWTPSLKAESGITYADNWRLPLASRKRCRDYVGYAASTSSGGFGTSPEYAILGDDLSSQIQRNHLDVERTISQHIEKVKVYIDEKSKSQMREWSAAVEQQLAKRIRAREEEIDRIGKLNWELEERIKSMCMEKLTWKDLAGAYEATANSLRRNLEEVLSQTRDVTATADDVESSCGSTVGDPRGDVGMVKLRLRCKGCGKGEARVLSLPCRHLSLCSACGSSTHVCPVCRSPKNASVVVNFS